MHSRAKVAELWKEVRFRRVSKEQAVKLVRDYVKEHPGCLTSEIIEELGLDPEVVAEALKELEDKGEVYSDEPEWADKVHEGQHIH